MRTRIFHRTWSAFGAPVAIGHHFKVFPDGFVSVRSVCGAASNRTAPNVTYTEGIGPVGPCRKCNEKIEAELHRCPTCKQVVEEGPA